MNSISASQDELDMILTQMGAQVKSVHGIISYIRFKIDDTELFYVYNINADEQFYLQMVKPYPVGAGVFSKPRELINYIKNDIKQFSNAKNSSVFDEFIAVNQQLHLRMHSIQDMFMGYNVPIDKMIMIEKKIDEIKNLIEDIKTTSTKIEIE